MGHKNAEGMAHVGVRLTDQLGDAAWRKAAVSAVLHCKVGPPGIDR